MAFYDPAGSEKKDLLVIKKPKKLLLVTAAYPPGSGGQASYARLLKESFPELTEDKFRVIILNGGRFRSLGFFQAAAIFFYALYLGRYCEAIYALDPREAAPARFAAKVLKKPFWYRLNADAVWPAPAKKLSAILAAADLITVPNEELKELSDRLTGEKERTVILPNIYPVPEFLESKEAIRRRMRVEGQVAVFAGCLKKRKNVAALIAAWPKVLENFEDAKLLIIGEGEERASLESLAVRLGVSDSVLFTGSLDAEKVRLYLRLADALVLPSLYEAGAQVLVEAKNLGTPVVACRVGDNEVLLKGTKHILLAPARPEELATAILAMLKSITADPIASVPASDKEPVLYLIRRLLELPGAR